MKNYLTGLAFSLAALSVQSCGQAEAEQTKQHQVIPKDNLAEIKFTEKKFDFGTIADGDTVAHTFTFRNTGKVPLVLSDVSSSCGCTIPNWSNTPVLPGKTGEINVVFTKTGDPGVHSRVVIIKANTDPEYTTVGIRANVTASALSAL